MPPEKIFLSSGPASSSPPHDPDLIHLKDDVTSRSGDLTTSKISKIVAGVETVLNTTSIGNPAANVHFHLQATANGTTLTVSVGTTQTSVTDSTAPFTTGSVGLVIHSSGGTTPVHQADTFQAVVQ